MNISSINNINLNYWILADECALLSPPGFWIPSFNNSAECPDGTYKTEIVRPDECCCQEFIIPGLRPTIGSSNLI